MTKARRPSTFHGVDRVDGDESWLEGATPSVELRPADGDRWDLATNDGVIASFAEDDLRYSVSWKAYCFEDDADRDRWAHHTEDLDLDTIVATLAADLRDRDALDGRPDEPVDPVGFAQAAVATYIRFPAIPADG